MILQLFSNSEFVSDNIIRAKITSTDIDSYGSIILTDGINLARYLTNPVLLWAHDQTSPPIGRSVALDISPNSITADFEFAPDEFAQRVAQLYRDRFIRGFSIAGRVIEEVDMFSPKEKLTELPDFARNALATGNAFYVIRKMELIEVSAVSVPANPNALSRFQRMMSNGIPALAPEVPNVASSDQFSENEEKMALRAVLEAISGSI